MAIYQRGDNWYIDFYFHGHRIREMIGPSRKLAETIVAKRKVAIAENKNLDIKKDPEPVKFHEFAKEYLKWARANKKHSTCIKDISIMRGLDAHFEKKSIHEITTWDIEKWKMKRKETLKPGSVNRELALVKHLFSKAVEWKKLKESPAKAIKRMKGETNRLRFLMPEETNILLSNCEGLLWGLLEPLVTLALHTGARKGELQNLKWTEIDFKLENITLLDTKNGERRDIRMDQTVRSTLEALDRRSEFVFPNTRKAYSTIVDYGLDRRSEFVFPNTAGKKIACSRLHEAFHEALARSGIEDFHFHDLRHSFASNLVMNGAELNDVRELLGHKKMEMTLRYAHLSKRHKGKVVNILDRVFDRSLFSPQAEKVVELRS